MQPLSEDQFASIHENDPVTGDILFKNRVTGFTGTMHYLVAEKWRDNPPPAINALFGPIDPLGPISSQYGTESYKRRACFACWSEVPGRVVGVDYVHNVNRLEFPTPLVEQHYKCGWDGVFAKVFRDLPSFDKLRKEDVWKIERGTDKWTLWEFSALARTIRAFVEHPSLISSAAWLYHMFGHEFPPWVLAAAAATQHFGATQKGRWKIKGVKTLVHTSWHCLSWDQAANFARVLRYVQENGLDISAWHNHPYSREIGGTDRAFMFAGAAQPYGRRLTFPDNYSIPKNPLLGKALPHNTGLGRSAIQRTRNLLQFLENCADIPMDWSSREPHKPALSGVLPSFNKVVERVKKQMEEDEELVRSYRRKISTGKRSIHTGKEVITDKERAAAMRQLYGGQ